MFTALFNSFESGMIYALMALGVYLTFRILDFPDMTVEGSFVTGASVSAIMIVNGSSPIIATSSCVSRRLYRRCHYRIIAYKGESQCAFIWNFDDDCFVFN